MKKSLLLSAMIQLSAMAGNHKESINDFKEDPERKKYYSSQKKQRTLLQGKYGKNYFKKGR